MKSKTSGLSKMRRRQIIFVCLLLAWPVAHYIFSWALNFNMFFMAFNNYDAGSTNPIFVGWDNFKGVFNLFTRGDEWIAVKNSLEIGGLVLFVHAPMALIFAYLLYTKFKGYKFWQVVLYLPCITSLLVLVLIYRNFLTSDGPFQQILATLGIHLSEGFEGYFGPKFAWKSIIVFNIWTGFSLNMLYFLSAMRRVSDDYIEAAKLDGASEFRIFRSIILPLIMPTVLSLLSFTMAQVFAWGMPSLLMMDSDVGLNGTGALGLSIIRWNNARNYGIASAYGVLLTFVAAPIMLLLRLFTNKIEKKLDL